jgi:epoxide hydrolase 4
MGITLTVFLSTIGGLLLLAAAFTWAYAPLRARRLSKKYARFRWDFEAKHDEIDSAFHHQDRVVKGIKWHYVDEGNSAGKVILFLHGLPEGWYSWHDVLPRLDPGYRLLAVDMKGYGRSDLTDGSYDWHVVARQTLEFMDSLGIKQFYVVSHDWGSIIGSLLVSDHSERILGYVRMEADLVQKEDRGKIAGYIQKPQWLIFQNNWIATYMMQDAGWFIDFVYRRRMTTPFNRQDRDYLVYEFSRPGVANMVPKYFQRRNWDLGTAVGKICENKFPFPVLQLQADSDPAQPPSIFAEVVTKCPNVRMEWITNASHFSNLDQPEQVAKAINRFIHSDNAK